MLKTELVTLETQFDLVKTYAALLIVDFVFTPRVIQSEEKL